MKLRAFIGTEEVPSSGKDKVLQKRMQFFMDTVADECGFTGSYAIIKETCKINSLDLYFIEANIPQWTEALFFVSYPEYRWDTIEEP